MQKKSDKIILTPHVGSYAIEALENTGIFNTQSYQINKKDIR